MREVNFSIPSANKASVGITTALYDRRALDCTSTLPLINSLNHLAYLTTSSARIREILTIDGGAERLIRILKNGRSKDVMDTWKWNLAFQCVVNIGVRGSDPRGADSRGSETIRTRVVEADVVPVLATILDGYMQTIEKARALQDESENKEECKGESSKGEPSKSKSKTCTKESSRSGTSGMPRFERRRAPPPIEVLTNNNRANNMSSRITRHANDVAPTEDAPPPPMPSSHDGLNETQNHYRHHHYHFRPPNRLRSDEVAEFSTLLQQQRPTEPFARPRNPLLSRDVFVMPPMSPGYQGEPNSSQPDTPTTPNVPLRDLPTNRRRSASAPLRRNVPAHQELSMSGDSDDGEGSGQSTETMQAGPSALPSYQNAMNVDGMVDDAVVLDTVDAASLPAPNVTGDVDADTFNITHRSIDGSLIDPVPAPPNPALELSPIAPPFALPDPLQLPTQPPFFPTFSSERAANSSSVLPCIPRDEDVIMSLQLLAYVSKYPSLRPHFQQTHLVPKLRASRARQARDDDSPWPESDEDNDEEYCQPDDYNIFPLVEKFTVRHHHHPDVNYWAGVVMRNLCRKDKSRGDIRQCAYYRCGKWEQYARQFAKCRRCRQTKYCSKDCQKSAWVYHRHWCEPAQDGQRRGHACPTAPNA